MSLRAIESFIRVLGWFATDLSGSSLAGEEKKFSFVNQFSSLEKEKKFSRFLDERDSGEEFINGRDSRANVW